MSKGERLKLTEENSGELRTCTFYLPENIHLRVKIEAAQKRIPMSQILIDSLIVHFKEMDTK
jgi:hypothetical protein